MYYVLNDLKSNRFIEVLNLSKSIHISNQFVFKYSVFVKYILTNNNNSNFWLMQLKLLMTLKPNHFNNIWSRSMDENQNIINFRCYNIWLRFSLY